MDQEVEERTSSDEDELQLAVRSGLVQTNFGRIVDLNTLAPIAYICRHTAQQTSMRSASELRDKLRTSTYVGDLDASLRAQSLRDAEAAGLTSSTRLLLNAEPESFVTLEDRTDEPDRSVVLLLQATKIAQAPAAMLRGIRQARELGWGIGVTGVGADMSSCAFLPLINPSVVVTDPGLLRADDPHYRATIIQLLNTLVEHTGAALLCDGIETEDDLDAALAMGARLGHGEYFGETTTEPETLDAPHRNPLEGHVFRNAAIQVTPHGVASSEGQGPLPMDEAMVRAMFETLEGRAAAYGPAVVVFANFGDEFPSHGSVVTRYAKLSSRASMVVMLSGSEAESQVGEARMGVLDASDPARQEWCVVVLGPEWAAMITAKANGRTRQNGDKLYDVYSTNHRLAVIDAARSLVSRVPAARPNGVPGAA